MAVAARHTESNRWDSSTAAPYQAYTGRVHRHQRTHPTGFPVVAAGPSVFFGGAYSRITNRNSSQCLEVPGANYAAGQQQGTAACNPGSEWLLASCQSAV
jgi:hypothetical protein